MGRQPWGCRVDLLGLCSGTRLLSRAGDAPGAHGQWGCDCSSSCVAVPRQKLGGAKRQVVVAAGAHSCEAEVDERRAVLRAARKTEELAVAV